METPDYHAKGRSASGGKSGEYYAPPCPGTIRCGACRFILQRRTSPPEEGRQALQCVVLQKTKYLKLGIGNSKNTCKMESCIPD